jgi:hypothetical protein
VDVQLHYTVWAVDFETPDCKLFLRVFLLMLPKIKKKREKVLLPAGVSKSAAYTVLDVWYIDARQEGK